MGISRTQGNIQPRIAAAVLTQRGIPDFPICGQLGPRFPFPTESGNGVPESRFRPSRESGIPFPVSRPNRESGERELGISGSGQAGAREIDIRL